MEPGTSWRRTAWTRARAELLPVLPIEVVRLRVRRARELGLPYKTYAEIRAASGHDLIGFLFSTNALDMVDRERLDPGRAARLAALAVRRVALAHAPLDPARLAALPEIDAAHAAPRFTESWSAMRDRLRAVIRSEGRPAGGYLLVGETEAEAEWAVAVKAAGFLAGTAYFAPQG
jgi:hypothetical protein